MGRLGEEILPETRLGNWSAWLNFVFFFMLLILIILSTFGGQTGGNKLSDNYLLAVPALFGAVCAVCAFICGFISFVYYGERSIMAIISSLIGFLVTIFLIGELLFAH